MKRHLFAFVCTLLVLALLPSVGYSSQSNSGVTTPKKSDKSTTSISATTPKSEPTAAKNAGEGVSNTSSPQSGERVDWDVISSGGGDNDSSANFRLGGTLGQTAVGEMSSTNFILSGGFWQSFSIGAGYLCGDADASGSINVADAVFVINYIFASGPAPNPLASFDNDCSGLVNVADIVYLINYIFASGPAPCASCK